MKIARTVVNILVSTFVLFFFIIGSDSGISSFVKWELSFAELKTVFGFLGAGFLVVFFVGFFVAGFFVSVLEVLVLALDEVTGFLVAGFLVVFFAGFFVAGFFTDSAIK